MRLGGKEIVICLRPGTPPEKAPEILRRWYIARAREAFNDRMGHFSQVMGVNASAMSVRSQKRRWGSCSSNGHISLNWKLVMAPPAIIDYVVAHELCHLMHRNHGADFWNALGHGMPDYAARRKWLKENGHKLGL